MYRRRAIAPFRRRHGRDGVSGGREQLARFDFGGELPLRHDSGVNVES